MLLGCLLAAEAAARVTGHGPWDPDEAERGLEIQPGGKLFDVHPTLGYALTPGLFTVRQGAVSWRATHLGSLHRATGASAPPPEGALQARDLVWIFGDSYSYGWGVDDERAYPWLLQERRPDLEVVSFAVPGYSTVHALFQLEQALAGGSSAPTTALLAYASFHDQRNTLLRVNRKAWISQIDRYPTYPRAWIERGELAHALVPIEYTALPLVRHSAMMNLIDDRHNDAEVAGSGSGEVTRALISRIRDLCRARGIELVLVGIDRSAITAETLRWASTEHLRGVDVSADLAIPGNRIPEDGHPSAVAHAMYAERIAAALPAPTRR